MKQLSKFCLAVTLLWAPLAQAEPIYLQSPTGTETLEIQAELAITPEQRQKGLMFRTHLPEKTGMLFVWPQAEIIRMWMKNTYIPLDMLFLNNNYVVHTAQNTTPLSKQLISSKQPVDMVLELPAGSIEKYGLNVGWSLYQWQPAPYEAADEAHHHHTSSC